MIARFCARMAISVFWGGVIKSLWACRWYTDWLYRHLALTGNDAGNSLYLAGYRAMVVAIPLMDMVAIMYRRLRKGMSAFPDRNIFHHFGYASRSFTSRRAFVPTITLAAAILAGRRGGRILSFLFLNGLCWCSFCWHSSSMAALH